MKTGYLDLYVSAHLPGRHDHPRILITRFTGTDHDMGLVGIGVMSALVSMASVPMHVRLTWGIV